LKKKSNVSKSPNNPNRLNDFVLVEFENKNIVFSDFLLFEPLAKLLSIWIQNWREQFIFYFGFLADRYNHTINQTLTEKKIMNHHKKYNKQKSMKSNKHTQNYKILLSDLI
jgi:hypothetical protein